MTIRERCRPFRPVLRRTAIVLVVVAAMLGLVTGAAFASGGPVTPDPAPGPDAPVSSAPSVSIVPDELAAKIVAPPGSESRPVVSAQPDTTAAGPDIVPARPELSRTADLQPVLVNSGAGAATLSFSASLDQISSGCPIGDVETSGDTRPLAPWTPARREVTLHLPDGCSGQTGTLMVSVSGARPVTVPFTLSQDFTQAELWYPIVAALVAGVLCLAVVVGFLRRREQLHNDVTAGSNWSFRDSWTTNVSALGGVLLTVLNATGLVSLLLPGRDTGRLVALNIVFTALVLVAPIIYSAWSRWHFEPEVPGVTPREPVLAAPGRALGAAAAAAATVAGVTGQLATVVLVAVVARPPTTSTVLLVLVVGGVASTVLLLLVYAVLFVLGVTQHEPVLTATGGPLPVERRRSSVSGTL